MSALNAGIHLVKCGPGARIRAARNGHRIYRPNLRDKHTAHKAVQKALERIRKIKRMKL